MTDENNNPLPSEKTLGLIAKLGIPDPVQRGLLKAGNRLLGSAIDIPGAWLEGISDNVRATSEARRLLRIKAAEELAKGFGSKSNLANRAYRQHTSKILGEKVNLEDIFGVAVRDLEQGGGASAPETEPEDDWLNTFRTEASQKSSPEMKLAFGRILSGEIQMPGKYSIRAVRTLGMLDTTTAFIFRKLCSLAICIRYEHNIYRTTFVVLLSSSTPSSAFSQYGINNYDLNVLMENGLINSTSFFTPIFFNILSEMGLPIPYANKYICFTTHGDAEESTIDTLELTKVGRELYDIVDIEENIVFTQNMTEYLKTKNINVKFLTADEI